MEAKMKTKTKNTLALSRGGNVYNNENEDGSYHNVVASVFIFNLFPYSSVPPPFGRVGVGSYILLFITMSSPLVMLSRHSGCSFTNDSMWRTRLLSNISSTAMRMPVSSTSPKP